MPLHRGERLWVCYPYRKRKKLPRLQSLQDREKTPCVQPLQERVNTSCVQSPQGREKTPCVPSQRLVTSDQLSQEEPEDLSVGGRLRCFLTKWEKQGAHKSLLSLIRDGYRLPFTDCPYLSRVPCNTSGSAGSDKQNALSTSIQELLLKGTNEVVHTQNSLGFYSRLFLVPKPGNHWRPVIDLSSLNKFLTIPKFKRNGG